jgi:hypothetical protein
MGLIDALRSPVITQLMSDTERQERHIKQLEAEIDVLKRSFSQDKEFVVTQNKILSDKLRRLENSIKWLYNDCSRFSYFKTAWNKHLGRIK